MSRMCIEHRRLNGKLFRLQQYYLRFPNGVSHIQIRNVQIKVIYANHWPGYVGGNVSFGKFTANLAAGNGRSG